MRGRLRLIDRPDRRNSRRENSLGERDVPWELDLSRRLLMGSNSTDIAMIKVFELKIVRRVGYYGNVKVSIFKFGGRMSGIRGREMVTKKRIKGVPKRPFWPLRSSSSLTWIDINSALSRSKAEGEWRGERTRRA